MFTWIRGHLRWAIAGGAAAFLILAGGTAYASFIINSNADVGPETISGHAPPSGDQPNIVDGSINKTDLASDSVGTGKITDGSVRNSDLGADSVDSSKIQDGTITASDVQLGSLNGSDIKNVHSIGGSNVVAVNAPAGGPTVNTVLVFAGSVELNSHCTHAANGQVTAEVHAFNNVSSGTFAATSGAPGGTTNTGTSAAVVVAKFGPTTGANLGSGTYAVMASFQPLLTGVVTVGTKILGHDCVFAANSVG